MKKRKQKEKKSGFIAARMPHDITAQIYELCQDLEISLSEFMRQAAEREIKRLQQRAHR